jgi:hypothetical protein
LLYPQLRIEEFEVFPDAWCGVCDSLKHGVAAPMEWFILPESSIHPPEPNTKHEIPEKKTARGQDDHGLLKISWCE